MASTDLVAGSSSTITIIGAGPVGLYTALLAARAGISVHVFEAGHCILQSPRAIAYFPVILEDFEKAGILDDLIRAGYKNRGFTWRKPKYGGRLAQFGGNDPSKFAIHLGQPELSNIILSHLKNYEHAKVSFDCRLTSFEQSDGKVTAHFEYGREIKPVKHISQYLVAADGGKSTVRKILGIPLEGFTWDDFKIIAANIVYDLENFSDWGSANFIVHPSYWAVVAKIGAGPNWRVASPETYEEGEDIKWNEDEAITRLRQRLSKILPGPTETAKVVSIAPYKMHQRCATTFKVGNVLLAGDAAHLTNPIGGLGLTTGLMDASLLARTFRQILKEGQSEVLLQDYADTRRDIFLKITSPTAIANRQRLLSTDPEIVKEREEFFAKLNQPDIPFIMKLEEDERKISSTQDI